jgi:hypothetical protein
VKVRLAETAVNQEMQKGTNAKGDIVVRVAREETLLGIRKELRPRGRSGETRILANAATSFNPAPADPEAQPPGMA